MENFQHVLGYPECKNAKPIVETISEPCPKCGGVVQVRKSKKGRKFYICENNGAGKENCDYISWNKPSKEEELKSQKEKPKTVSKKTTKKSKKQHILQKHYIYFTVVLHLTKRY